MTPHYYQNEAVASIFNYFENGGKGNPLVCMPTACHAIDTEILMYDGSVKLVQDVVIGDLLMGPDSKPRTVLNLARGVDTMYEIQPHCGESFIVNSEHKLSLKTTQEKSVANHVPGRLIKGCVENIAVWDYLAQSNWYKHTRKLWRTTVDFKPKDDPVIDAWIFGCLLGDGSFINCPSLTTMDKEIADAAYVLAKQFGLKVLVNTKPDNRASSYMITGTKNWENQLKVEFENLGINNLSSEYKFVPNIYKHGSREDRLKILAGLLDTDGYLSNSSVFDFISKSRQLAQDVQFIARSVGLRANISECKKGCQTGAIGIYFRVCISGEIHIVPTRLERKKPKPIFKRKSALVTGFNIIELDKDEYYGFTLDGDHLYLTSDFIVHHNSGKSIVIAKFLHDVFKQFPNQRVMMLTHVWKLILQNADKMQKFWPTAPLGIHSAGLGMRDTIMPIVFGGVQSVVKNIDAFGHRDLLLIDEAHLLGHDEDTQYLKIILGLTKINPYLKVIGFTATPYRMKMGVLTDGGLFSDVAYDITDHASFVRLIAEGYLSPLIGKVTQTKIDGIGNLHLQGGDFNQKEAEALVDRDDITYSACKELLNIGHNRNKCMVFAAGVNNAEHIAAMLQSFGANVAAVHSKLSADENKARLEAYSAGELWGIVGANMLTTGYDEPRIDLIADFQPTCSPGKHVQKLGRGTRVAPGKENCLVMDFVGNIRRNGPIDDPVLPRKPGKKTGDAPIKICGECDAYNHASARFCCNCAIEFPFAGPKIFGTAANDSPMRVDDNPIIETVAIKQPVFYNRHEGKNKGAGIIAPPTVKATYILGLRPISIYLCFEHTGKARRLAHEWWMRHSGNQPPSTVDEFLQRTNELRIPKAVKVHTNLKFPDILAYDF